jgi:putative ABC transport system ATP-binding protein
LARGRYAALGSDAVIREIEMVLFETRSLCRYYRTNARTQTRALDDVSLVIDRGSITVINGPSGSGKTTLLALLGALERPTRGQVYFEGDNLGDCSGMQLARVRRRLGFIFQDFALIPNLTVEENITYSLIPLGLTRTQRSCRARELLARFGMEAMLSVRARSLSGGEKQRVAIARALAGQPEALLADEPTSNLDPSNAEALLQTVRQLHAEGKTVVLSSHDPAVIALATHRYELDRGKLKEMKDIRG